MKKFILLILLVLPCSISAQVIFSDSVRHYLKQYLVNKQDAGYPEDYDKWNLRIKSLTTYEFVEQPNQASEIVDILSFRATSPSNSSHILLIYNKKYYIINMNQSYSEIMKDLISFFENNPEVDDRILPLFNQRIYIVFLSNTSNHQKGCWYDWWNQRDSLSKQLNVKYEDW